MLPSLHKTLHQQGIDGRILVDEQANDKLFNSGKLLNIGAHYSWDNSNYFCFHDVDMIPSVATYQSPGQPLRPAMGSVIIIGTGVKKRMTFLCVCY